MPNEWRTEEGWRDNIQALGSDLLDNHIGAAVLADMVAGVPVDTGELRADLDKGLTSWDCIRIGAKTVDHAAPVEEGHRIVYKDRATGEIVDTGRIQPAQPYMKPALYRQRGL
jgi:hypothetical protein